MYKLAEIIDSTVVNVSIWNTLQQNLVDISNLPEVGIGWKYIGGKFICPPIPKPPTPEIVTMRQARLALLAISLLDDVDVAIAAIPDPLQRRAAEIEWEYAQVVERNSAFTIQLAQNLGLTDERLDELFTLAATL